MANLSSFLAKPAGNRAPPPGPGSNGFFRREFFTFGTYAWVAPKDGRVKLQGLGSGSAGAAVSGRGDVWAGSSGAYGDKVLEVRAGQVLNLVVPTRGQPLASGVLGRSPKAGTLSISGVPVGPTPLVLEGAEAHDTPGVPTGPWDRSFPGARAIVGGSGSPSSGSPFGAGKTTTAGASPGWGENVTSSAQQQSGTGSFPFGSRGPTTLFPFTGAQPTAPGPWWDMEDILNSTSTPTYLNPGTGRNLKAEGVGAPSISGGGQASLLGGGTSISSNDSSSIPSGYGAGGQCPRVDREGGPGGESLLILFYDEVTQ